MKVYIVVGHDYDGTEIGDVFLDKQLAEDIAAEKNKFKVIYDEYMEYSVIEKEVLNERLITKKDKLAIRIMENCGQYGILQLNIQNYKYKI